MGSMSAANEEIARRHAERIRKLLEDGGYSNLRVEATDAGGAVVVIWRNSDFVLKPNG